MTKKRYFLAGVAALVMTASAAAHAGCIDGCDDTGEARDLSIGATLALDSSRSNYIIIYDPIAWVDTVIRPTNPKIRDFIEDLDTTFYPRPDNYNFVCDTVIGNVSRAFSGTEIGSLLEWGTVGNVTATVRVVTFDRGRRGSSETVYCD